MSWMLDIALISALKHREQDHKKSSKPVLFHESETYVLHNVVTPRMLIGQGLEVSIPTCLQVRIHPPIPRHLLGEVNAMHQEAFRHISAAHLIA